MEFVIAEITLKNGADNNLAGHGQIHFNFLCLWQKSKFDKIHSNCYVNIMIIEQTIDILPDHRLVFDLPFELPIGKAKVKLTITPEKNKTIYNTGSAFGCFHRFADSEKINGEKNAWAQASIEIDCI